jgi:hypothetical protein
VSEAKVHLPWGGRTELLAGDFSVVESETSSIRGPGPPSQLIIQLGSGVSVEPDLPLSWQRVELLGGIRLAGANSRWVIFGSVGWQGHSFDLQTQGKYVRSDSLQLSVGGAACFDLGSLVLLVGPRLRADLVFQRELPEDEGRHDAADLDLAPTLKTLRLVGFLQAGVLLPISGNLSGNLSWGLFANLGCVVQPAASGSPLVTPVAEVTTGPAIWW